MAQQTSLGGNAVLAGPSPDVFYLKQTDNQGAALVDGTRVPVDQRALAALAAVVDQAASARSGAEIAGDHLLGQGMHAAELGANAPDDKQPQQLTPLPAAAGGPSPRSSGGCRGA